MNERARGHASPPLVATVLAGFALALTPRAQETPPAPHPVPVRPAAERPAPQEPAAGAESPTGQEPQGPRARGGRRGARGGGDRLVLPEFTPVAAPPPASLSGRQFFWFTMYPDLLAKFDPTTDEVVQKVKLNGGLFWSTELTHDRRRMLVVTNQQQSIEVVDLTTGTIVGSHLFQEEGFVLRIRDVRECPGGAHWLVRTDRVKKEIDRYAFEPAQWLLYDSKAQKVVQKLPRLPEQLDRGARLSADGTQWLASDDDGNLLFLDARTFEEQGRIDLKTPRFAGAGSLRLSGTDLLDGRDPARALMLFTEGDPVEKSRTTWGVVELDLARKRIVDVAEWGPSQRAWGLRVAPKKMVGAMMSGGRDDESRLVTFDLRTGKQLAETYEKFRPRRMLVAISPDADKLYVGVAGSDFEVFDANLKRLPTVELEGEVAGTIHVVDG